MKPVLLWLPAAVLSFLVGAAATAYLTQPNGLSDCVIKLAPTEKLRSMDDPSSREIAQIYAEVLGEKGIPGLLHRKMGYWIFEVFDDAYRTPYTTISKSDVRKLRSFGLDEATIERLKIPSVTSNSLRQYLTSIPSLILKVDGSQFVFDKRSKLWVPVEFDGLARGGISVSDIVFSSDRSLAMVRVGVVCGSHCGGSGYYVLQKSGGTWQIAGDFGFADW